MKLTGKIIRMSEVVTKQGRLGAYQTQNVLLDLTGEDGLRQSVFGTFFGQYIEAAKALNLQFGDRVEVDAIFTTSERNGFISNYVEFIIPRKL